jgi:hypothetical protein
MPETMKSYYCVKSYYCDVCGRQSRFAKGTRTHGGNQNDESPVAGDESARSGGRGMFIERDA